ncbi:MAG TPA: MarR family transcriptional regulator [Clostridia bacterium]
MESSNNQNQLREMVRVLERKLGILQEYGFSCCGITLAQCHALVEIGRVKRISLNELAELLSLENSTMSRTVNNLVTNELVERNIDPQDRRYVAISLTEKGHKLYEKIEADMNVYFTNVYDAIPENKKQQVIESIQMLLDAISKIECCK